MFVSVRPKTRHKVAFISARLDESLQIFATRPIVSTRQSVHFRRGDFDLDGSVNLGDAVAILRYMIEAETYAFCPKAADIDDSGRLTISDPVALLLHLFGDGRELPAPFASYGFDATDDNLACERLLACR